MARFFFHLGEHGITTEDPEGSELVDLAAAQHTALNALCEVITEQVREGQPQYGARIEINDARGTLLLTLAAELQITVTRP